MIPGQDRIAAGEDRQAAVALQTSLMPGDLPEVPGVGLAARYFTGAGIVGGDWYDVFVLPDGKSLGIVVGDVAGSGFPAAVVMGRMRSALRAYVLETGDPAVALGKLDRKIQYFEAEVMATVLYGIYAPGSGELTLSTAGHPPPVLAVPDPPGAELTLVEADPPIGVADAPDRQSIVISVPPGGLVCFYTDGLVERRDRSLDDGFGRLADALRDLMTSARPGGGSPVPGGGTLAPCGGPLVEAACDAVMRAMVGAERARDDVALLLMHRVP